MTLLPIRHLSQRKKRTCFSASGPPFQPTTWLSRFSGGNPEHLSIKARNLCLCVCLKYLCISGSDWPEIFNMAAAWFKVVQRWICSDYNDTVNKWFHKWFTNSASIRRVQDHAALPKSWCMLVKMCPWWRESEWFILWIRCHITLSYCGSKAGARQLQSSWAVALQVLCESRPTFMTSGLCPNWLLSTLTHMTSVSMNFHIHKHLCLFSTQISHTFR